MNDKIALLKKAEIFSKLQQQELKIVAKHSEFKTYPDNEVIFKSGSLGNALYIIKQGEVRIISRSGNNEEREIAHFIKGECFGEIDFFENAPRTADAVAETDTTLLCFPAQGFLFTDILEEHPSICARILHKLVTLVAGRIRHTNKLVSEKVPWIEDLRKQVLYDKLTGLYNRSFLDEDFNVQLPGYGDKTSFLVIKPDNFKEVNDKFGHAAGDKVLRVLADMVKAKLTGKDIGIRLRGDEFALVLPNQNQESAQKIAEELKQAIFNYNMQDFIGDEDFHLTVSIGIAVYPVHTTEASELVTKAFDTMWRARTGGGNKVLLVS
ncbi:MAG: GGDEF domain-containing protein [Spirochaetales bacterium]|nr:GGDEF domain-containing protein [Spirochaetales bacterium]